MSTDSITTLISNMGFPIVACGALMWYVYKIQEQMRTAINDLTNVITKLNTRIDKLEVKNNDITKK